MTHADPAPPRAERLAFRSTARTCAGPRRALNEDAFLDRPDIGLWAVADGMGGHERGELASGRIVEALNALTDCGSASGLLGAASNTLQRVHRELRGEARRLGPSAVIGSTVVVLVAGEDRFACLWAGDSRLYRIRKGALRRITRDHSLVQELVDARALTEAEARLDPRANIVTRAVGADADLKLELGQGPTAPGDLFLICTDGLTGVVADGELAPLLTARDLERSADRLMALALSRAPPDNVTFVLAAA